MTTISDELLGELRQTVSAFLGRTAPPLGSEPGAESALWGGLGELGVLGLLVPEEHGGADVGLLAPLVVAEELAYHGCSTRFVYSAIVSTSALVAGTGEVAARWLPKLTTGAATATTILTGRSGLADPPQISVGARSRAGGTTLDGDARFVAHAADADLLVTAAAAADGGIEFHAVEAPTEGVAIEPVATMVAGNALADVAMDGVAVSASGRVVGAAHGDELFDRIVTLAVLGLCADSLGVARRALDLALEYAKDRHQFGRPIGSFQAIKHKLADMYVAVTGATAICHAAARAVDRGDLDDRSIPAARLFVREAAARVAGDAMQIHGAIGYTWEHECHWLLKRAKFNERYLSNLWRDRDRMAGAVLDGEA